MLKNQGGTPDAPSLRRRAPICRRSPRRFRAKPPEGFPKFDPAKPDDTDFQLQQALVLAKAMAAQNRVTAN